MIHAIASVSSVELLVMQCKYWFLPVILVSGDCMLSCTRAITSSVVPPRFLVLVWNFLKTIWIGKTKHFVTVL